MMLFDIAGHALTSEINAGLAGVGVSSRQYCVLSKARAGTSTQREIAAQAGLDKSTMVVTLDQLERAGLAERRPSPTDRRARTVVLTRKGRDVLARAEAVVSGITDDVLATIPGAERAALIAGLRRLVEPGGRLAVPVEGVGGVRRRRAATVP
jgi:MarR family transcriptional regulator for hemolysin